MINIDLICDVYSPSGYSCHAREVIKALLTQDNVSLKLIDHKHDRATVDVEPQFLERLKDLQATNHNTDIIIQFETPEFFPIKRDSIPRIGFTQWETTRIPDTDYKGDARFNWVKQMNNMSAMWTSCSLARQAFIDSGVRVPIEYFLGPVDTEFFKPGLPELEINDLIYTDDKFIPRAERPVVLGCIAQWTARKNIADFLVGVLSNFKRDEVTILLKTYGSNMSGEQNDLVIKQIQSLRNLVNNPNAPRVVLLMQKMTDEAMARLFSSIDIIVNPSKGEGFCLPLVQGMASGCIPLSNSFSAPSDYIDVTNGFLIPYTLEPAVYMPASPWYRYNQNWGRIDVNEMVNQIRKAMHRIAEPITWDVMKMCARNTIINRMSHKVFAGHAMASIHNVLANAVVHN